MSDHDTIQYDTGRYDMDGYMEWIDGYTLHQKKKKKTEKKKGGDRYIQISKYTYISIS